MKDELTKVVKNTDLMGNKKPRSYNSQRPGFESIVYILQKKYFRKKIVKVVLIVKTTKQKQIFSLTKCVYILIYLQNS